MSHVSRIELQVKSLEALKAACDRLGFQFVENQDHYAWFGRWVGDYPMPVGMKVTDLGKCTHAIRVPGAKYEIGVQEKTDGTFELRWDFWSGGGLIPKIGAGAEILKQAYAVEAAKLEAQEAGFFVTETVDEKGTIELELGRF